MKRFFITKCSLSFLCIVAFVGANFSVATTMVSAPKPMPFGRREHLVHDVYRGGGGGEARAPTIQQTNDTNKQKLGVVKHASLAVRELAESAAYGFVYATFALLFAGWVDAFFPKYQAVEHHGNFTTMALFLQVAAQAGVNAAVAQLTRRIVASLPLLDKIDGRTDKRLPAAGGGVVFAFLMFTRQSNWKAKVAALDALLDQTILFP